MTVFGLSWGVAAVVAPAVGTALLARGSGMLWLACAAASLVLAALHASSTGSLAVSRWRSVGRRGLRPVGGPR